MSSVNVTLLIEQLSGVTNETNVYVTTGAVHSPHDSSEPTAGDGPSSKLCPAA